MTKVTSNKNDRLYQGFAYTAVFASPTGFEKSLLVLDLIEKEYNKHFDYIIIINPTLR